MEDPTGARLVYWPRAWAARAMAYVGDDSVGSSLIGAISDEHWRVRMNAISASGRLGLSQAQPEVIAALDDEHHRVRAAAVVALGRIGDDAAMAAISGFVDRHGRSPQSDNALERIARKT